MTQNVVHVRASRAAIRAAIMAAPKTAKRGGGAADAIMVRCGMAALGRIKRAFVAKARGEADETGLKWKPLSPKTIAYSRRGGRTKTEGKRKARPSQALSVKQQARWWDVYRRSLRIHNGNKGHAAAVAWIVLKKEGAVTLLSKYGHRNVEILRDTGLLLNSLSPGYRGSEQILRVQPGEVVVGTNRKGAAQHHKGIPGRLPQRRLWPDPKSWTKNWWNDILDQLKQGILDLVTQLIKGAG